jgi:ligand-binding sensor domain-containing protein
MKKYFLNSNELLLSILLVITSCNGQVKTDLPKDHESQQKPSTETYPMMVRIQGANSGNITCELEDRDGSLWFSTGGEGVYRFDGKSFTNFTTKDGLCDNDVGDIIQCKSGDILIATQRGICVYDGKVFRRFLEIDSINKFRITSLLEDRDGNIWFGVMNRGIYRYDGTKLSTFLYEYEHPFFGKKMEKYISDIIQDKNGNIWFSSWNGGGVWRYDGKTLKNFLPSLDYYKTDQDKRRIGNTPNSSDLTQENNAFIQSQDFISDDMIYSITEDKAGNIWFATRRHGACRYDGKAFTSFRENEAFVNYGVYSILEDKKGNMWFSTEKKGVFCFDGKTFKNYTTSDGLVNDSVFSILEDKSGNLWFGTRWSGLSRFNGKTFTTFSEYKE